MTGQRKTDKSLRDKDDAPDTLLARASRFSSLTVILLLAAVLSSIFTFYKMTDGSNVGENAAEVLPLVIINLVLLLGLVAIVLWKILRLRLARKRGSQGSRMQVRIVRMFSLVSVAPTIVVAIFSAVVFNQVMQTWFDDKVRVALDESVLVARDFIAEKKANIRADILSMSIDLNKQAATLNRNPKQFSKVVWYQSITRDLTEAVVFKYNRQLQESKILGEGAFSFSILFEFDRLPSDVFERADNGELVVLQNNKDDRVRALIKLAGYTNTYLLVGRAIDPDIMARMERTKKSVEEYRLLYENIYDLQLQFAIVFVLVAVMLLLAAIWVGMIFAGEIVRPIGTLLEATERVKEGNFDVVVEHGAETDEIATLGHAFNDMMDQLKVQRQGLIDGNKEMDARRRMIEAVFSGVTAGVIALNSKREVTLINRSAEILIGLEPDEIKNQPIGELLPQVAVLMDGGVPSLDGVIQDEIKLIRHKRRYSLLVRVITEKFIGEVEGYIITLDDVTELQTAQRTAAWADVARRIAHEIKNPLTPISLSADRIRTKYGKQITEDKETFDRYINTISRHIDNIGKIVEEFSNFARMPSSVLMKVDLIKIIQDAVFSEKTVNSDIEYRIFFSQKQAFINGDASLLTQVFTNLLKNAKEAIEYETDNEIKIITLSVEVDDFVSITIEDNGSGFPTEIIDTITEPYVTTREKGTGLGLAVVKKVIGDHDGVFFVSNAEDSQGNTTGAQANIVLPIYSDKSDGSAH